MPVVIPKGKVKVATISDLTAVRALSVLTCKHGPLERLKDGVKKRMRAAGVKFAQSDFAIADLRGDEEKEPRKFADPAKLLALLKAKFPDQWEAKFLSVLCVRTSKLPEILSKEEIEPILEPARDDKGKVIEPEDGGSLYTDWKSGVAFDPDVVQMAMLLAIEKLNEQPTVDGRRRKKAA